VDFRLVFSTEARDTFLHLKATDVKRCQKVQKILAYMETNLRHPSLKTHKYDSLTGPNKEDVFEAYVENNTPGAWRIFWYYGPDKSMITILAITPHP
jgi:hypothetical protein